MYSVGKEWFHGKNQKGRSGSADHKNEEERRCLCPHLDGIGTHEPFPLRTDQLLQFPDTKESWLAVRRRVRGNVNPRIDTKKCCCQSGRMAWNQGLSEIRNSPATHSLRPIVADIMTTAQMILTTATEKMTTPQAMVTTAERNVTTPADNSKISYKHETFYILFKFANSVKAPKAQIRKKRGKAKHYLKSPRVTYWQHRRNVL